VGRNLRAVLGHDVHMWLLPTTPRLPRPPAAAAAPG
jgi:hypothetical protein